MFRATSTLSLRRMNLSKYPKILLHLTFLCVACSAAFGIRDARSTESLSVYGSKLVALREGIDDIGDMTLRHFIDRLSEFNVNGTKMKITIHPRTQSDSPKSFEIQALDGSKASSYPIRFTFLPSRIDRNYVVLATISYKNQRVTKLDEKFQILTQLAILRMDTEGIRKQEEETLRHSNRITHCVKEQRQWLSEAEKALRQELTLPDDATYAERQRVLEDERQRKQELRDRSMETFDRCVGGE